MHIKNIHVQIYIYIHMYTYIRRYTYTYTLVTFSAEVTLFAVVSLFRGNREIIFSHKIHLKLFQKQYNSLIEKVFLIFLIFKKNKDLKRVGPPPDGHALSH